MTGHISGATIAEAVSVLDEIKRLWPNNGPVSLDLWMRAMRVRIELAAALPPVRVEQEGERHAS